MEITITRYFTHDRSVTDRTIDREEWIRYIRNSRRISPDQETRQGRNPLTGQPLSIAPQPDVACFIQNGATVRIHYNDGDLNVECDADEDVRAILGQLAKELDAVILDEEQNVLKW